MPNETKPLSLAAKLASIMGAVGRVPKNGYNSYHQYHYALEADILEAVRGELARLRVIIVPSLVSQSRNAVDSTVTDVVMNYVIMDGDGNETLPFNMPGAGQDKGDKGVYKAITGAQKYALMKLFLLPTGDDPEAENNVSEHGAVPAAAGKGQLKAGEPNRGHGNEATEQWAGTPPSENQDAEPLADLLADESNDGLSLVGTVEVSTKKPGKKGEFLSLKIGDLWLNCFDSKFFPALAKGRKVRVSYEENRVGDKTYRNITGVL